STSPTSLIGVIDSTLSSGEIQTFFPQRRHIGKDQYPFSPLLIHEKQDRFFSLELRGFFYISSSSEGIHNPTLTELVSYWSIIVVEEELMSWAL
ncbi:hypothetical protein J1N35_005387, partial [Gossypium stocksii]